MKRKIYIVLSLLLLAASCRMWEKDDDLRPSPDFGFTSGTSTGYTTKLPPDSYLKVSLKATHDENMESLVVSKDSVDGEVLFNVNIGAKTFAWRDSTQVGSVADTVLYYFTVRGSGKARTRAVTSIVLEP